MWNKKGSVTVEALVCFTTIILLLLVMFQLLVFHANEDLKTQKVYEALEHVELANYTYEKIGFLESMPEIDHPLTEQVYELAKGMNHLNKKSYLKLIFSEQLKGFRIDAFELEGDWISGQVSYEKRFILSKGHRFNVHFKKRLWLFGNDPSSYPNKTLGRYLNDDRVTYVYVTKTGTKYHLPGCFYLNRSTTDQLNIQKLTKDEAVSRHYLPCKRCYGQRSSK